MGEWRRDVSFSPSPESPPDWPGPVPSEPPLPAQIVAFYIILSTLPRGSAHSRGFRMRRRKMAAHGPLSVRAPGPSLALTSQTGTS